MYADCALLNTYQILMSNKLQDDNLTILFMPQCGCGPMNIGIGYMLQQMGHQWVFVIESSWKGKLLKYSFIEKIMDISEKKFFYKK